MKADDAKLYRGYSINDFKASLEGTEDAEEDIAELRGDMRKAMCYAKYLKECRKWKPGRKLDWEKTYNPKTGELK